MAGSYLAFSLLDARSFDAAFAHLTVANCLPQILSLSFFDVWMLSGALIAKKIEIPVCNMG